MKSRGTEVLLNGNNGFTLPRKMEELGDVKELDLSHCSLIGHIPASMGALLSLKSLNLQNNKLTGEIPSSFRKLTKLAKLDLQNNQLQGLLHLKILQMKHRGAALFLNGNTAFALPANMNELGNDVVKLDLSNCSLTGRIPSSIGLLEKLERLNLQGNKLSGGIPGSFEKLKKLVTLNLSKNWLEGELPVWILKMKHRGADVQLNGNTNFTLPAKLDELKDVVELDLSNCSLTGHIPSSIGSFESLERLNLQGNKFAGGIPGSFEKLKKLVRLNLSKNDLEGELPTWLLKMKHRGADVQLNGNTNFTLPAKMNELKDVVELDL
jgi:Leucine-rich repeat (LRR) protein